MPHDENQQEPLTIKNWPRLGQGGLFKDVPPKTDPQQYELPTGPNGMPIDLRTGKERFPTLREAYAEISRRERAEAEEE